MGEETKEKGEENEETKEKVKETEEKSEETKGKGGRKLRKKAETSILPEWIGIPIKDYIKKGYNPLKTIILFINPLLQTRKLNSSYFFLF